MAPSQAATLVNQWKFDGNVNDTSGNNNNGTLTGGGSSYVPGVFGDQALYLATNDMVTTTNAVDLPSGADSDWSMNLWLYLTNDPVPLAYIAGFGSYTGPIGASRCLIVYGGTDNQDIYVWGYAADLDTGVAYPLNQWVMLTVTHSGVSAMTSVYTNGVDIFDGLQSLATIPAPDTGQIQVNIQVPAFGGTQYFNGIIDDFTIWSGVLSTNDIAGLYASNALPRLAPQIVLQPSPVTAYVGEYASLSVSAENSGPFTYQWFQNGTNLSGQTAAAVYFAPLVATNAGLYTVIVSNAYGSATSSPPTLVTVMPVTNITAGLAAYWTFYEPNGFLVNDVSGNGNNGVMENFVGDGSERVPGIIGQALHFRGPVYQDYVQITNGNIRPPATMTIAGWINVDTNVVWTSTTWASILKNWPDNAVDQFHFGVDNASGELSCYVGTTDFSQVGPVIENTVLPLGQWVHVAFTADGTNLNIYRNGVPSAAPFPYGGTLATNIFTNASGMADTMAIGVRMDTTGFPAIVSAGYWQGSMDDLAVWTRGLTPAEIHEIYIAGMAGLPLTQAILPTGPLAPYVTQQPVGVLLIAGQTGTLSVVATDYDTGPLSYQWQKRIGSNFVNVSNGGDFSGTTNATLTISHAYYTDAGTYQVVVSNSAGATNSLSAVLTVLPAPTFANLTNGLVLHLNFDSNYNDSSGHGNNALPEGSPSFIAGRIGSGAVHVNTIVASNIYNYVAVPENADFVNAFGETGPGFSVSFWVRYTGLINDLPMICNAIGSTYHQGWVFTDENGMIEYTLVGTDGGSVSADPIPGSPITANGAWHNVVATFDRTAGAANTFVDGALVDTRSIFGLGNLDTGSAVTLGQDPTGTYGGRAIGAYDIDDVGIWSRVLTQYEALSIYGAAMIGQSFDVNGPVSLSIKQDGGSIDLIWQSGSLQSADSPIGPWNLVNDAIAPFYQVTPSGSQKFYRIHL